MCKKIHRGGNAEQYNADEKHKEAVAVAVEKCADDAKDDDATPDDLREAVTTLEEMEPTVRRVFGGAHPTTTAIEGALLLARSAQRARETPSPGSA